MGRARGRASCGVYELRALLGHTSECHSLVGHSAIDLPDILYHTGENLVPRRTRQDGACRHSGGSTLWLRESHFEADFTVSLFPVSLSGVGSWGSHLEGPRGQATLREGQRPGVELRQAQGNRAQSFRFNSHPFVP